MKYVEHKPSKRLAKYIKCFWTLEKSKSLMQNPSEPIVPDGCLELIFNLSDSFRRHRRDGIIETQPKTIMIGQMKGYTMIEPSGCIKLFGIRFQSAGAYPFFKFPLFVMTNSMESLELIWGQEGRIIEEQVNEAQTTEERILIIENTLLKILAAGKGFDPAFEAATKVIIENKGLISIERITEIVSIKSRRLERKFQQSLGITPKVFSRIIRFQNLMKTLKKEKMSRLLDTAFSFGYYDQSHLNHDFKEFSGKSPSAFFGDEYQLSELFILSD
jgi:AraC-like DNA-binding protein